MIPSNLVDASYVPTISNYQSSFLISVELILADLVNRL
jgi:hypothetical protein